jgi:hypothetical protein
MIIGATSTLLLLVTGLKPGATASPASSYHFIRFCEQLVRHSNPSKPRTSHALTTLILGSRLTHLVPRPRAEYSHQRLSSK